MIPPSPPTDPEPDPPSNGLDEPTGRGGGPSADDGVPDFRAARRHVLIELVRLAAVLRDDGVEVPPSATLSAGRALSVVGLSDREAVEAALRASLLSSAEDADAFDSAFPSFWHRLRSGISAVATDHDGPEAGGEDGPDDDGAGPDADDGAAASDADTLEGAEPPDMEGGDADGDVEVRIPTGRRHATGERAADPGDGDRRRASAVES
ncbi:VWA containing CoxE-like protein, partial [Halobaculum sp. WSA2]|nr:VWA containing CoxE-like protein [Halobaculum saliterrae]